MATRGPIWRVVVLVVFTMARASCAEAKAGTEDLILHERNLHTNLLMNYYKWVRPVHNASEAIHVKLGLTLMGIEGLDDSTDTLTTHIWLRMNWNDMQLSWNPDDYGGVTSMRINVGELWTPDIQVFNSVDDSMDYTFDALPVIQQNGDVLFIPQIRLKTRCSMDLTEFPFDTQHCRITLGSWTYDESKLNLTAYDEFNNLDLTTYTMHRDFDLVKADYTRNAQKYDCCPETYVTMEFALKLRRRTNFSTHIYLAPSVVLSLLTPFIFALPLGTSDKMVFGIGLLFGHVLMFGQLEEFVPKAYPLLPRIATYFLNNIVLLCFALVITIVIINVWKQSTKRKPVPRVIKTVFLGCLGRVLCMSGESEPPQDHQLEGHTDGDRVDGGPDDREHMVRSYTRMANMAEWRQLAAVLDRLMFIVFCVLVFIVMVIGAGSSVATDPN